jgi:hypothetical protein
MTAWSDKTKPTPANIRKRLAAAYDALEGAQALIDASGETYIRTGRHIHQAKAWARDAIALTKQRGARR